MICQQPGSPSWPQHASRRTARSVRFRTPTSSRAGIGRVLRSQLVMKLRQVLRRRATRTSLQQVSDERRVRTRHTELSLEEIADALPGTGELMASVGRSYGACWHAAHGGNWDLAAYLLRRVRGLQRTLAVVRPKYRDHLAAFDLEAITPLMSAIEARDLLGFDRAYDHAVERANEYHALNGKSYIRWKRPERPPDDLDLGP
jgi:hypothetical protein